MNNKARTAVCKILEQDFTFYVLPFEIMQPFNTFATMLRVHTCNKEKVVCVVWRKWQLVNWSILSLLQPSHIIQGLALPRLPSCLLKLSSLCCFFYWRNSRSRGRSRLIKAKAENYVKDL